MPNRVGITLILSVILVNIFNKSVAAVIAFFTASVFINDCQNSSAEAERIFIRPFIESTIAAFSLSADPCASPKSDTTLSIC